MIEQNLKLLARDDLGGSPYGGEGLAVRVGRGGRRYLYVAHVNPPIAFSVLDVTEPSKPRVVFQLPTIHARLRTNSLSLAGDVLLVASEVREPGDHPGGMTIYDVSEPALPRQISFFDTSGGASRGAHFVSSLDGEYAHLSTGAADFSPANPKDHQFYMVVDIRDPSHPREVGRWWLPGQREGDVDTIERHVSPSIDQGFRLHHALSYPRRPDRAYLGYIDAGVIILDISDRSRPSMVGRLDYHPPAIGFTHTVVPIFDRNLLIVSDEASGALGDDGYDWPKRVWIVDATSESEMEIVSTLPDPPGRAELHEANGRIGAHNLHENEPYEGSAQLHDTVVATWFSAGLRIYDIADASAPIEIAAFLPETPDGQRGSRINDVFVDDRGIIFTVDRAGGGLYVLEYTGSRPLA